MNDGAASPALGAAADGPAAAPSPRIVRLPPATREVMERARAELDALTAGMEDSFGGSVGRRD